MIEDNYFKLIIEDTRIEILVHSKCQEHIDNNIEESKIEAYEYLLSTIDFNIIESKYVNYYYEIIDKLIEYCITEEYSIVNTYWDNIHLNNIHIKFIQGFQKKYKAPTPVILNYAMKPFGSIFPIELQRTILQKKYKNDLRLYNLHRFVLRHSNPVLEYLRRIEM